MRAPRLSWFLTVFLTLAGVRSVARAEVTAEFITLSELLQRALVDPPRVLSAQAALARADADRSLAQSSYFPSLMLQGSEGIAYDTDGRSWITTSEGKGAPVHRIPR